MKLCSIAGCQKPHGRRGLCAMHAMRLENHGDVNFVTLRVAKPQKDRCPCGAMKCCLSKVCLKCVRTNAEANNAKFRHGHNGRFGKSPTYNSWDMMKQRCTNPKYTDYRNYGVRGIQVCERWMIFKNFLDDMGERPEGKTLDRKDNNGGYSPENCKWSSRLEQVKNMRKNVWIEHDGQRLILADWAKKLGITYSLLRYRFRVGLWPN